MAINLTQHTDKRHRQAILGDVTQPVHLDGHSLDLDALERAARGAPATIDPVALAAAETSHRNAAEVSRIRPVYGRTTGVGAAATRAPTPRSTTGCGCCARTPQAGAR